MKTGFWIFEKARSVLKVSHFEVWSVKYWSVFCTKVVMSHLSNRKCWHLLFCISQWILVISLSNIDNLLGFWSEIENCKKFQILPATSSPQTLFIFCWRCYNSRLVHRWNLKFYTLSRIMLLMSHIKFHSDSIYRTGVIAPEAKNKRGLGRGWCAANLKIFVFFNFTSKA